MPQVTFILEDPVAVLGRDQPRLTVPARIGDNLLDVALEHGIQIEHACGGVCACSTCHVYITGGSECLGQPADEEMDRVEEAPDVRRHSRLSCQSVIERDGTIEVTVPAWNRNAVKERPH